MKISPITNNNTNSAQPSFKTKLPHYNCQYSAGWKDYWTTFTKDCIAEGKESRLVDLLNKLANNSDNNVLSLVYKDSRLITPQERHVDKVDTSIAFMLNQVHNPIDEINVCSPLHSKIILKESMSYGKLEARMLDDMFMASEASRVETLLYILEKIITPKASFYNKIFGTGTAVESILKDFRAK